MTAKQFSDAMNELDGKYVTEALICSRSYARRRLGSFKRIAILAAAVMAFMILCGFAAYELGLFDPWLQEPSADPIQTVQSAIEGQAGKGYTIAVRLTEIKVDETETAQVRERYMGSDLAAERGWTDEMLAQRFIVVWAKYDVEYDHTKTFLDDGPTEQFFYLIQDEKTEEWSIVDNTSPRVSKGR